MIIEAFCFFLMYKNSNYQSSVLLNSSNSVAANAYQVVSNVREYLFLKNENDRLSRENLELHNLIRSAYKVLPLQEYVKKDTLYMQEYTYVGAKTVNSSTNRRNNYITINVGSAQGIKKDMAVVNSDGVIGIVKDVSLNFASVMSLLHKDTRVNCQLKRDGSYGPLVWDGKDYRYCHLTDIPTHAKMRRGDTVISSELSGIFPEGINVGTIDTSYRLSGEPFFTARVKLLVDFKKLNHVFVIKNRLKLEKDSLEHISQTQSDK
jgi:rod shape-determining protein MreC